MGSTPSNTSNNSDSKVESPKNYKNNILKNNLKKTSSQNSTNFISQQNNINKIKLPSLNIKKNSSYQSQLINTPQHIKFEIDTVKIAILGMHIAVGKSTLLKNFKDQEPQFISHNPTIGIDLQITQFQVAPNKQITYKIYEIQNSEQVWKNIPIADIYFLVFDEFDVKMEKQIKEKIQIIQGNGSPKQIILVGNDKLNMKITGKEKLLQSEELKQMVSEILIINFNNMKEVNDLFIAAYNIQLNNKNFEQQQLFPIQRQNSSTNETNSQSGQQSNRYQTIEEHFNKI